MACLLLDQIGITLGDLPTWISAFAAVILAIITYKYVKLVKAQSDAMTDQGKIMQESIKRDQITRKYERLVKEMNDLVGPLFSKMDDHTAPFFTLVSHSREGAPFYQEIYDFWRDIKMNIYLAPTDLRQSLGNYLECRQKFRRVMRDASVSGEEATATRALFDQAIEDLKPKIRDRYDALSAQLEECEKDLRIN
ncbi:MAG: hypothetical protein AB9879_05840 [Methanothrix sp.]|jgi:hypothetical protein